MPLSAGSRLGPYEILASIGAGGMGEVYRGRDSKLGRDVAIKVLPEAFARDADRLARFQREAKLLASLNHSGIAAIYGQEDSGTTHALVMELVEGPTLADRIKAGAIPFDEALRIAKQICEALEYAHERGVVHRDLKPANIKISPDDSVKILDFGLAKAVEGEADELDIANSPTITRMATQAGVILGTAAYMSPEQAKAKPVDRRADIWAFGCVLYEMLTGQLACQGDTVAETLAAVLKNDPDWTRVPKVTPVLVRVLLQRCLQKDPKQRLRDIGDARIAIDEILSGGAPQIAPALGELVSAWRLALPWVVAGVLAAALIAGGIVWKIDAQAPPASMHFSAVTSFAGVQAQPAISPDGRSVAFVSDRDGHYNVYVGLLSGGNLIQITHDANFKSRPAWSPDGSTIAYAQLNGSGLWDIWETPALGGTPRRVILNAGDPAWSPDGHSLAYVSAADHNLWITGSSGENARPVASTTPALRTASAHFDAQPRFSPDGREIAYIDRSHGPYGSLKIVNLSSGQIRQLTDDTSLVCSPAWSPNGRHIFFASSRSGTVNIWQIDVRGGESKQITAGQGDDAQLDVSPDGTRTVFSTWRENQSIAQLDLAATRGEQNVRILSNDPGRNELAPTYSPDGKYLAYFSNLKGAQAESIWISNSDGSNAVQLVKDGRVDVFPRWTADGQNLIYLSRPDEYRRVSVNGGEPEIMLKIQAVPDPFIEVGPDGRLLFRYVGDRVEIYDSRDKQTESHVLAHPSDLYHPVRWSPDGRSIGYVVRARTEGDPNAGLWVEDFKNPPLQIFRGWVSEFAPGPQNQIFIVEGKPDLRGLLYKVGWDGRGLVQTSATIPIVHDYWIDPVHNTGDHFSVSPDARRIAFASQSVLSANIGMIENVP